VSERDPPDPFDDLRDLWLSAPPTPAPLPPLAELRRRATRLERRVRVRNALEWAACGLVAALFAPTIFDEKTSLLLAAGHLVCVVSAAWIAVYLHRRGRHLERPPHDAPTLVFLAHHRRQLERQIALLKSVPRWYLAPLALGVALIYADRLIDLVRRGFPPSAALSFAGGLALSVLVFVAVAIVNRRAAHRFADELAKLPRPHEAASDSA
jgi:hypothetical protein